MKRYLPLLALAPGLLMLATSQAKADWVAAPDAQWTYSFTPSNTSVFADKGGSVSFASETGAPPTGDSHVTMTALRATSSAPANTPENLNSSAGAYTLHMSISMGGATGTMDFTGNLSGSLSSANTSIGNTFDAADLKQSTILTVGDWQYKFSVHPVTSDDPNPLSYNGPPNPVPQNAEPGTHSDPGTMGVDIVVEKQFIGVTTAAAPEPSSLLLSCLGLSFLGASRYRKRRLAPLA
jgi:hypothetical protein